MVMKKVFKESQSSRSLVASATVAVYWKTGKSICGEYVVTSSWEGTKSKNTSSNTQLGSDSKIQAEEDLMSTCKMKILAFALLTLN